MKCGPKARRAEFVVMAGEEAKSACKTCAADFGAFYDLGSTVEDIKKEIAKKERVEAVVASLGLKRVVRQPQETAISPRPGVVLCDVEDIELEGDYVMIDSVSVTCRRCQNTKEAFGRSEDSVTSCLVRMRTEGCPLDENNRYEVGS